GCVPHRFPNHLPIGIDGRWFVESPKSQIFKKSYPRILLQHKPAVHGAARARSTISERSRERGEAARIRRRAPSAFAWRACSIVRQLRNAVARRAETCGFF